MAKKRVIKKFDQISDELMERIREQYPDGFEDYVITYTNPKGEIEIALPLETEDISYLIKIPKNSIPEEDDDFDISSELSKSFENIENIEIDKDVENEILEKNIEDVFDNQENKDNKKKFKLSNEDFDDDYDDYYDEDYEDDYDDEDSEEIEDDDE